MKKSYSYLVAKVNCFEPGHFGLGLVLGAEKTSGAEIHGRND